MQFVCKYSVIVVVFVDCSLKKVSFILLLRLGLIEFSRVNRVSTVRVGVRVSVRFRVSLVLVTGWG